jgi:hypothetical protein
MVFVCQSVPHYAGLTTSILRTANPARPTLPTHRILYYTLRLGLLEDALSLVTGTEGEDAAFAER